MCRAFLGAIKRMGYATNRVDNIRCHCSNDSLGFAYIRVIKLSRFVRIIHFVYARHGRELMGCKSPMCEPGYDHWILTQTLADDKGGVARPRLKEVRVQSCEPTNRNVIQGRVCGQVSTT
jgi:hypothetical protein